MEFISPPCPKSARPSFGDLADAVCRVAFGLCMKARIFDLLSFDYSMPNNLLGCRPQLNSLWVEEFHSRAASVQGLMLLSRRAPRSGQDIDGAPPNALISLISLVLSTS